ncbi:MAG: JDVT-CTERM system glutamic-type intramembrane protease MrtJ [Desulfovibrio sp.]
MVQVSLIALLIGSCTEEILFRALLQDYLSDKRTLKKSSPIIPSGANILTSLVFATLHLFTHSPIWAAATFFPSLIFGEIWDRHKKLSLCIALHAVYNLSYFYL